MASKPFKTRQSICRGCRQQFEYQSSNKRVCCSRRCAALVASNAAAKLNEIKRTKFVGVTFCRSKQKWVSRVYHNYQTFSFGNWETKADAIAARTLGAASLDFIQNKELQQNV